MEQKTVMVPNVSCDHCVRAIKNELVELEGVKRVEGNPDTKMISVEWEDPATWQQIADTMTEIEYAPAES